MLLDSLSAAAKATITRQFCNAVLFPLILWGTRENILPSIKRPHRCLPYSPGVPHLACRPAQIVRAIFEAMGACAKSTELDQKKKKKRLWKSLGDLLRATQLIKMMCRNLIWKSTQTEPKPASQPHFKWRRLGFEAALPFGALRF